jgi:hypothetical protein
MFAVRNVGKTLVTRTSGTKVRGEGVAGKVFGRLSARCTKQQRSTKRQQQQPGGRRLAAGD